MKQETIEKLTLELKEELLLKPVLKAKEVQLLTGFALPKCYTIMDICRKKYGGKLIGSSSVIRTKSLMLYLDTTLEDELRLIGIAKGYIPYEPKE